MIDLAELEGRALRDARRLDGLHGDPSRAGGWIGHRDYARALVELIPRLRAAEHELAALRAQVVAALSSAGPEVGEDERAG